MNTVCLAFRILSDQGSRSARHCTGAKKPWGKDGCTAEVSLPGWRTPSPAVMLAQFAWDVHRESNESHLQMSPTLLA